VYDVGSTETIAKMIERMVKCGGDGLYDISMIGSKWFDNGLIMATSGRSLCKAVIILVGQFLISGYQ
jgi:hypothetical protein